MIDVRTQLQSVLTTSGLPEYTPLFSLIDHGISATLESATTYRPQVIISGKTVAGTLLDFTSSQLPDLPLIVVPDLHARAEFLTDLLEYHLPHGFCSERGEQTVLSALSDRRIRIVCLGDALHSEVHTGLRWKKAWGFYQSGNPCSAPMTEEMHEELALLQTLMIIKSAFPEQFHFLKGNHENILNSEGAGNHPFYKYADEGNMVRDFLHEWYDDALVHLIDCWERSLPLCALFPRCVLSHAEPARVYTRNDLMEGMIRPDVAAGLTWTDNDEAEPGTVPETLGLLLGKERAAHAVWIGGHRPIAGTFALRQNGTYVQIHNPEKENVALIYADRPFNPVSDIYCVAGE
jgi:hypothetical protein